MSRRRAGAALAAAVLALTVGCSGGAGDSPAPGAPGRYSSDASAADPETPTGWGPTAGELEQARGIVAGWDEARLAGQVIVGRYHGTDPAEAARLVADLGLAGVSVTSENVVDEAQVRETTSGVAQAHARGGRTWPPVIGVDQEGGLVSHLRGIATEFPAYSAAGPAIAAAPRAGRAAVREAATATGLELRMLGFTWVFAPVADVTIGAADPTIGSRSPSTDPALAAAATKAAVAGFNAAGMVSTTKHFPGHGAVTADSHEVLPVLDTDLADLRDRDLVPFVAAVEAQAPAVMVSHVDVRAIAPGVPASLAPETYEFLSDDLGFDGIAITDSLGMGAVMTQGGRPAVDALVAGADLLLMPADTRRTHRVLTRAITNGEVDRELVEEAAARVVALQMWQQRRAEADPLPADADVVRRAQAAAAALEAAAY